MENNGQLFIETFDEENTQKLIKAGFRLLSSKDGHSVFENNPMLTFASDVECTFTNHIYV